MSTPRYGRREFLRRAGLTAGTMAVGAGAAALTGCGNGGPAGPQPPAAPTNLVATAVTAVRIDLSWSDNAANETSYEVERRLATEAAFTPLATLDAASTGYTDEAVAEKTMYAYRVRAVAEALDSPYSNEAEATTPAAGAPLAPHGVAVGSVAADGAVLTWTDAAVNENGYRVERVEASSVVPLLTLPAGTTRAELTGLAADDLVRVQVVAFNELGDSPPSAVVAFFTGAAVAGLTFQVLVPGRLHLEWIDRTAGRLATTLERDAGPGFEAIATIQAGESTFDDDTFTPGVVNRYRVSPAGAASTAPAAGEYAVPDAPPPPPAAFAVSLLESNHSQVRVTWEHAGPVDGFIVGRRNTTSGAFTTVSGSANPAQRELTDNPGVTLVNVTYRALAFNLFGTSAFTDELMIRPRAIFSFTAFPELRTVGKARFTTLSVPSIAVGASCQSPSTSLYFVRVSESVLTCVVAHCTHECLRPPSFNWVENESKFRCAHGSEFDPHGQVIRGPAARDVAELQCEILENSFEVIPITPQVPPG
jgi:hypothetical protein